jgi:hypothetical protein
MYHLDIKCTKWQQNIPNRKNYTNTFHTKALQNWEYWYEYMGAIWQHWRQVHSPPKFGKRTFEMISNFSSEFFFRENFERSAPCFKLTLFISTRRSFRSRILSVCFLAPQPVWPDWAKFRHWGKLYIQIWSEVANLKKILNPFFVNSSKNYQ